MNYINTILVASSSSSIANHLQRLNYRLFRTQGVFACKLLQKRNDKPNLSCTETDPEIFGGGYAPRITFLHTFLFDFPLQYNSFRCNPDTQLDFEFFSKFFLIEKKKFF